MPTIRRLHDMPFGAQIQKDGQVRFRLWAPKAQKVELSLTDRTPPLHLPLTPEADGWHAITTRMAPAGSLYQFKINEDRYVPDPASRCQSLDVHGPSRVVDPENYQWNDGTWQGLPWEDTIIYQLHVGAFSEEGTFAGVIKRLDYLVALGVTALQLMPVAEFAGARNWGYDGVFPFAPEHSYGGPEQLKALIDNAHTKGLMVFNDVVINHFGPEGNYLHCYAASFFNDRKLTPWGSAINFDSKDSYWVRQFFIHNALYWLEEFHFDGLRIDAAHALYDDTVPDILEELALIVRQAFGRHHIHLILENDNNAARYLHCMPQQSFRLYDAQWNDDFHHSLQGSITGDFSGYYQDYQSRPAWYLGRCLTEGFAYQGETSLYRNDRLRGEYSRDLPLSAFLNFLQNHDQIGNHRESQRIASLCSKEALRAATAILILSPSPPMLFMGQEWASEQPFPFFTDFPEDLGNKVAVGRADEVAKLHPGLPGKLEIELPHPNEMATFTAAKLNWHELERDTYSECLTYHRQLIRLRRQYIIPLLKDFTGYHSNYAMLSSKRAILVEWRASEGIMLKLLANLDNQPLVIDNFPAGDILFATLPDALVCLARPILPPWQVVFLLEKARPNVDSVKFR